MLLSIALGTAGCGGRVPASPDTGAKQSAERYFRALIRRDWSAAYDGLDAASKARVSQAEFARRAEVYLTGLKLNPSEATAGAAQESELTATVHVAITGRGGHGFRRFKDTVTLRKDGRDWKVELPRSFGRRGSQ
ncbi:MAG: hypothetical protein K1X57_05755 [Gemmataceae bacterium]|nr:hypothetical protein [Gemmataceae bacterium]